MRIYYTYNNTPPNVNLLFSKSRTIAKNEKSDFLYVKSDHLGNVRATIKKISTGVCQVTSWTDYYAFGGAMPGRTYNLTSYQYNFQGQENAVGTNWQQFDLRMHNSDLGRWMAPDPAGQFHSPYISMGNNPISGVDPDGGYVSGGTPNSSNSQYYYNGGKWFYTQNDALAYEKGWSDRYWAAYKSLENKYGGIGGLQNDAGYSELFDLRAKYGMIKPTMKSAMQGGMSDFAHGGSIAVLEANGQNTGYSYEAQESNKIQELASLGGYEGHDGSTYSNNGDGEIGTWMGEYIASGDGHGNIIAGTSKLIGKHFKTLGNTHSGGRSSTVEDVLRYVMGMKEGAKLKGNDIGNMNPKFSKAGYAVDDLEKLKGNQVKVNLTWAGRMLTSTGDYTDINGAVFNLTNFRNKDNMDVIHIQSNTAQYNGKPFNLYINDNTFSIDGSRDVFFGSLFNSL